MKCLLADGCHSSPGRMCEKKRNRGAALTSRYGLAEVYGYLAIWLRNALQCPPREAHVRGEKPSLSEIGEYVEEHGWLDPFAHALDP